MAGIEKLTDKAIKASSAAGKPKTIGDGGGLVLEARPIGSGWRRLRYSFAGRENRLSLGTSLGSRWRTREAGEETQ